MIFWQFPNDEISADFGYVLIHFCVKNNIAGPVWLRSLKGELIQLAKSFFFRKKTTFSFWRYLHEFLLDSIFKKY